jgi:hypothetical protein
MKSRQLQQAQAEMRRRNSLPVAVTKRADLPRKSEKRCLMCRRHKHQLCYGELPSGAPCGCSFCAETLDVPRKR